MTNTNHVDVRQPIVILLAGAALAGLTAHALTAASGKFTPPCARLDLRAYTVIEERGEAAATPAAWLANAGLNYLQARTFCLSGEEQKAIVLYRRIIDGDPSLTAPHLTQ